MKKIELKRDRSIDRIHNEIVERKGMAREAEEVNRQQEIRRYYLAAWDQGVKEKKMMSSTTGFSDQRLNSGVALSASLGSFYVSSNKHSNGDRSSGYKMRNRS